MCKPWSSNLSGCCCCDLSIMRPATGKVFFIIFFYRCLSFLKIYLFDEAFSQEPVWKTILIQFWQCWKTFTHALVFKRFLMWIEEKPSSWVAWDLEVWKNISMTQRPWVDWFECFHHIHLNAQGLVLRVKPFGWMLKVLIRQPFWDRENTTGPLLKASWFTGE